MTASSPKSGNWPSGPRSPVRETEIRPPSSLGVPDLTELWRGRDLLWALTIADMKARYRQTIMGFAWNILQPLIATLVFTVVFGQLGAFSSDGQPYALFFFSGFLVWQFFFKAMGLAVPSLSGNAHLIAKVYFPRLIVVVFPMLTALLEFGFATIMLVALYVYFQQLPTLHVVFVPLIVGFAMLTVLACALWLAPLNVYLRDVQMALGSLLQFGFFVTPIFWSSSAVSETWRWLIYLNPMAVVVEAMRWALIGTSPPPLYGVIIAVCIVLSLIASGLVFFQRTSQTMVDRL